MHRRFLWYQPHCTDTITYDQIQAQIRNASGATLATVPNVCSNSGSWTSVSFDTSAFAGQTVVLWFNDHDDGYAGDPTYFLLDDVAVDNYTASPMVVQNGGFEDRRPQQLERERRVHAGRQHDRAYRRLLGAARLDERRQRQQHAGAAGGRSVRNVNADVLVPAALLGHDQLRPNPDAGQQHIRGNARDCAQRLLQLGRLDAGELQHERLRGTDGRALVQRPRRRLSDRSDVLPARRRGTEQLGGRCRRPRSPTLRLCPERDPSAGPLAAMGIVRGTSDAPPRSSDFELSPPREAVQGLAATSPRTRADCQDPDVGA